MEQIMKLQLCVLVIFFLLALLLPVGFLRRRCKSVLLKAYALGIYTSTYLLLPYILGLMRPYGLVDPFSVVSLVFVYGSVDKVNALDLNDRASVTLIWVKNFAHFVFAFYIIMQCFTYQFPAIEQLGLALLLGCLLYSFYKIAERVYASQYANGNDPNLTSLILNVSKSLPNDLHVSGSSDDPLLGCKYVVNPHYKSVDQGFTTVDRVLNCEDGSILSCTGDPSCQLKNTCLSFSLFWLLLHRFVGVPSYESSHQEEAWKFVKHGMLSRHVSPFTTIEVELAFLYDFFYSKYFLFYLKGFCCQMMKLLVLHGLFISYGVIFLFGYTEPLSIGNQVVLVILVAVELVQFVFFLNSRWSKMMLICMYIKRESWKKQNIWDCCIKKAAQLICPVRGEWFKPWQRKLAQFSLLESSSSRRNFPWKIISVMTCALAGIQIVLPGRKQSNGINLTEDIKEAVIQSLWDRDPQLTNGIASLEVNDQLTPAIRRKLIWACKHLNTDAQVILVWHIATSFCEINPLLPQVACDSVNFHVATSLSKYCAYLVAFAPDLLPGNAAYTDHSCTMAIEDIYTCIKDCESSKRYDRLMEIAEDSGEPEAGQRNTSNILELGVVLGKVLDTEITDECNRWKVLADFWAELILYLAPNMNNEWAHARRLADGGEFITHLWALLFHAGIVDRDFVRRPKVSASSLSTNRFTFQTNKSMI